MAEAMSLSDSPQVVVPLVLSVSEDIGITDSPLVEVLSVVVINVAEAMSLSDSPQVVVPLVLSVSEDIGITDSPLLEVLSVVVIDVAEAMISDSPQVVPALVLDVSEDIRLTDSTLIEVLSTVIIDVAEAMGISDSPQVTPALMLDVSEDMGLTDDPAVVISLCGSTITTNTTLDTDLTGCPGTGLEIRTDGITLDCAGHTITGPGPRAIQFSTGILVRANNVTVSNCNVTGFDFGLDISPVGGLIDGNEFWGNVEGAISRASGVTWSNNTFRDNLESGARSTATGNVYTTNIAAGNGVAPALGRAGDGFHIPGDGARLTGHTANDNFLKGIAIVGADNVLVGGDTPADGNTANNNSEYGIYLQTANNNTVSNNTATGNSLGGIRLQSLSTGNLVSSNQVFDNGLNPAAGRESSRPPLAT